MSQKKHNTGKKAETDTGVALEFTQSASKARSKSGKPIPAMGTKGYNIYLLRRCLSYFSPYKLRIVVAVIGLFIIAASEAATAYIVKPILDGVFIAQDKTMLIITPLAYIGITLCMGTGRIMQNYMMHSSGLKVLETLRDELYSKIIKLPLRFYEGAQVGNLMARIINDVAMIRSSLPAIITIVRQILTIIGLGAIIFTMNAKLALISIFILPIAFYPFIYFGRRMRKLGRRGQAIYADASVLLHEILSGIRVVKAFSTESEEGERFDHENRRLYKVNLRQSMANEYSSIIMEIVGAFGIGIVIFIGGLQVFEGTATPGEFGSFVAALALLYAPIKKLSNANNSIQNALAGAERVFAILDSEDDIEEEGGTVELPAALPQMEMRFENVTFAYNDDAVALKDINLTIHQGERIALVGPSGAGKTTFINLLPRFYDPTSGRILLNGLDLREYTLASLRHCISIVSQDNFLFNYSIRENIAYGQPGFSEEKVIEAAKAAYAHDFIMDMPDGYATVVGERGVKLSGGQKQRLTIARAIAKNAPILILDEATSALDSESEKIVQQALENLMKDRTSLVIAHRLSTILGSDRILVMQNGRIEAQGTHKELLESSPLYAKLYSMQFGE